MGPVSNPPRRRVIAPGKRGAFTGTPVERFAVPPHGRAGYAVSAVPGDVVTLEGATIHEPKVRIVVVGRCLWGDAETGRYVCLTHAARLANRYQLVEHAGSDGRHVVAVWCDACRQWEPCDEWPADHVRRGEPTP